MAVIFDLDLTLVDSRCVEPLRRARRWRDVYARISECMPYPGIPALLQELTVHQIPIAVVTSSPRPYCERILEYHGWNVTATVCFHDTKWRKPHPEPIREGLRRLGVQADHAISVGDDPRDIVASRAAGVKAVAALWDADDPAALRRTEPDVLCHTVVDLRKALWEHLSPLQERPMP